MSKILKKTRLIILDVDGTLTDGGIYLDNNGVESKKFNVKDGAGIVDASRNGIDFMILTGRRSNCVDFRAKELNIKYVFQGITDKFSYLKFFLERENILPEEVVYMGDDVNDLKCIEYVGYAACPKDAVYDVKCKVDFISNYEGGKGAVRELCDMIIKQKKDV